MKYTLSAVAFVATLLAHETLAGVVAHHPRHGYKHVAAEKRSPSECATAPEINARALVYVTETITRIVTIHGTAQTAAAHNNHAAYDAASEAAHSSSTKQARISLLEAQASVDLANYYRTKDQKPTTLQTVAAIVAPTSTQEIAQPAATVAPAVKDEAEAEAVAPAAASKILSGGKRGLAYNNANLVQQLLTGTTTNKASWAYNWGSTPGSLPSTVEYVPMLWGVAADHTGNWVEKANSAIASGSTHLLGFNEPDHQEQAKLGTAACASGYQQYMQPFAGKAKLGAPAVTNGGGDMGLTYLQGFLNACSGCTIDFVPIHWYDSATNFEYFKKHIQDAKAIAGDRPIWVTEFGASGSDAEQAAFLLQAVPWLDSQDYVERYAYFWVDQVLAVNPTISAAYFSG